MNINLFDQDALRDNLLPFTYTRPVSEIRIGILTISDKWRMHTHENVHCLTQDYLQQKYPANTGGISLYINGGACPTESLAAFVLNMKKGEALFKDKIPIAWKGTLEESEWLLKGDLPLNWVQVAYDQDITLLQHVWDIFTYNRQQVIEDFAMVTRGRTSSDLPDKHTVVYGEKNLFIEEGANIRAAVINADRGPVYIGKNAQIHEGAILRGATSLGEGALLNVNGRVIGDSCIGPFCKVGGEISNSVIFGNSNKSHDGFIGNSVLGEWCNLGADTNTSNLKNTLGNVKLWNYVEQAYVNTGRQFCGLMMGDHSMCGINTMFNTGTIVEVGTNIYGAGFQNNFIPSFSWGGVQGFSTYQLKKFLDLVPRVFERRNKVFGEADKKILRRIFEDTKKYRTW